MAKVSRFTPPVQAEYHLVLSEDEAIALLAVCAMIGGEPEKTRGVFSDVEGCIGDALQSAVGLSPCDALDALREKQVVKGNIYFE